jgi:hypothetical protein
MGLMQHNFVTAPWLAFFLIVDVITQIFIILTVIFHLVPSVDWMGHNMNLIERLLQAEPAT